MKTIENKVSEYCKRNQLIEKNDKIILGVSGGADSVCLLFLLNKLKEVYQLSLYVVHVNHCIRDEAKEDANYVATLCEKLKIPYHIVSIDVHKMAKEQKLSIEEAGRDARYKAFTEAFLEINADKIAVAHNNNDRAETMLFHLFRGSGLTGLCSIKPKRDSIIRPILCLEREEIEYYLKCLDISFCIDSTNMTDDFTRNKIRNNILPYVENNIAKNAINHISNASQMLLETEEYIDDMMEVSMKECITKKGISIQEFQKNHKYLQKRMIYKYLKSYTTEYKDITSYHINEVLNLINKKNNAQIDLPHKIKAIRKYDYIVLEKQKDGYALGDNSSEEFEINISLLNLNNEIKQFSIGNWGYLECSILLNEKTQVIPQNKYTKWFDYDKIEKSFIVRTRKTNDYYLIYSKKEHRFQSKKIKEYMINQKISNELRNQIPLLSVGNHILWVMGYRTCEGYNINKDTKRILQIKWKACK